MLLDTLRAAPGVYSELILATGALRLPLWERVEVMGADDIDGLNLY